MSALSALKPSERIVDAVHAALRVAILDGSLLPGQALSVPELSRQLDVSRSPVREAVLALVADGLAVEQPRRGVAVAEIAVADMVEIHEVREGVEAQSARLCAERASPLVLRQLVELLEQQAALVERGDASGWYQTNADFHRLVAAGASNSRLFEMVMMLEGRMRLGLRQVSSDREQRRLSLVEHQAILGAIAGREPDAAERLMQEHIRRTRKTLALQSEGGAAADRKPVLDV